MFTLVDRYVFRVTFGAFLLVLVSLTGIIWITQALRQIDLITNQGQTILVFLGIAGLLVPILALIIAPISFIIAVIYTIDKLNGDSEFVVMNAAGMSPWQLFRPFLWVAIVVFVLVGSLSAYVSPNLQRQMHERIANARTDLVTNIVRPGEFVTVDGRVTFHVRERRSNGDLFGIMIDDRGVPGERSTILAEQGSIVKKDGGTFLLLENGSIQRVEKNTVDPKIVQFERYAFDLSRFGGDPPSHSSVLSPRERYLWQLLNPDSNDLSVRTQPGPFRAELHDRLLAPIYPLAFLVTTFAAIGGPRSSRQSRGFAVAIAIAGVAIIRLVGFACIVFSLQTGAAIPVLYGCVFLVIGFGALAIHRGIMVEPPEFILKILFAISDRMTRTATPQPTASRSNQVYGRKRP